MATPPERSAGLVAARIGAALALCAGTLAVLRPFLVPMLWAAILAYITWPVYRRLRSHTRRPRLAALLFTAAVAIGLGVPVALLLVNLADDASSLVRSFASWSESGFALPAVLADSAWVQAALERARALPLPEFSPAQTLAQAGREISRQLVALAGGIARNAFKFSVTFLALYAFFVSGEETIRVGRRLAKLLFPTAPAHFVDRIGDSVRAVVFGLLGTALVQGLLTGLGLAVAGVPSAVALATASAFISFLPGGGGAVTLTAALWLALSGRLGAGVILALWGMLVVSSVDNVLRPLIISGQGRIPFLWVFFGVVGGLAAFGLIGVFVGPVLLSVSLTLLAEFAHVPPPILARASGSSRSRPDVRPSAAED